MDCVGDISSDDELDERDRLYREEKKRAAQAVMEAVPKDEPSTTRKPTPSKSSPSKKKMPSRKDRYDCEYIAVPHAIPGPKRTIFERQMMIWAERCPLCGDTNPFLFGPPMQPIDFKKHMERFHADSKWRFGCSVCDIEPPLGQAPARLQTHMMKGHCSGCTTVIFSADDDEDEKDLSPSSSSTKPPQAPANSQSS